MLMIEKIMEDGFFFITAADHRNSLKKMVDGDEEKIKEIKKGLAKILSSHSSGFLLDPVYGLDSLEFVKCGLLLSREKSGYSGEINNRKVELLDNWNVRKLLDEGADAIKILVYYNPEKNTRDYQEKVIKELALECKKENVPLLCEFMLYDVNGNKDKMLVESSENISKLGIDILKTEAPSQLKDCEKITKKIRIPWVVLSGGKEYKKFKESVVLASEGGASGFAGGRAIWQDTFQDEKLLKKVSVERIKELKEIFIDKGNPI